jgi:hypothetical protein
LSSTSEPFGSRRPDSFLAISPFPPSPGTPPSRLVCFGHQRVMGILKPPFSPGD